MNDSPVRKKIPLAILAVALLLRDPPPTEAQSSVLLDPLGDRWTYDAVEALELRGLSTGGFLTSKPWSTEEIEELIEGADSTGLGPMADPFVRGLVDLLNKELAWRRSQRPAATLEAQLGLEGAAGRYELDPPFRSLRNRDEIGDPDLRAEARLRLGAGWPGARLTGFVDGRVLSSARNRFDVHGARDDAAVRIRSAYLLWENERLLLALGRIPVEWGNGRMGGLAVTAAGPSLDGFLGRARWKYANATVFSALLEDELANRIRDSFGNTIPNSVPRDGQPIVDRYLYGHRVDIHMGSLDVGVYEVALVSGVRRHFDLRFASGLLPYSAIQLERDEIDEVDMNLGAGGQYRLRLPLQILLYGEYFGDEVFLDPNLAEVIRGLRGKRANRQGFQQAFRWVEPFGTEGLQLEAEWIRLEPFLYLHRGLNTHWRREGIPIGSFLGPDTKQLAIAARYDRFLGTVWTSAELGWVLRRRGIGRITGEVDIEDPGDGLDPPPGRSVERQHLVVGELRFLWPGVADGGLRVQAGRIENADNMTGKVARPIDLELYVALNQRLPHVR